MGESRSKHRRLAFARGLATLLLGAAATYCAPMTAAYAGAKITVTYDVVYTRAPPNNKTTRKTFIRVYTLSGRNNVGFVSADLKNGALHLGDEGESKEASGAKFKWTYRTLDGVLYIVSDYETFVTIRKILTDGVKSCVCELDFRKKAGRETYDVAFPGGSRSYSDISGQNMACSIEPTSN